MIERFEQLLARLRGFNKEASRITEPGGLTTRNQEVSKLIIRLGTLLGAAIGVGVASVVPIPGFGIVSVFLGSHIGATLGQLFWIGRRGRHLAREKENLENELELLERQELILEQVRKNNRIGMESLREVQMTLQNQLDSVMSQLSDLPLDAPDKLRQKLWQNYSDTIDQRNKTLAEIISMKRTLLAASTVENLSSQPQTESKPSRIDIPELPDESTDGGKSRGRSKEKN